MYAYEELTIQYTDFLKKHPLIGTPENLYDPMNYILGLGGKRIRPVLALMGYNLFKDHLEEDAFHVAHTVELFHNFSLIHDDIMDEAPLRRGNATVHTKWNMATAILSGDLMLVKAYERLLKSNPTFWPSLLEVFNQAATDVCEGQQKDMDFEHRNDVTEAEYIDMIRQKTAVLLGASLQMGALVAGAGADTAKGLYRFGVNAGLAFQIMDDYLDVFGAANSGKQAGGDIVANKKTLIYLLANAAGNDLDRSDLNHWYSLKGEVPGKVSAVTQIFQKLEADQIALATADAFYMKADMELQHLNLETDKMKPLNELINILKGRTS